jgi:hypothetical protein
VPAWSEGRSRFTHTHEQCLTVCNPKTAHYRKKRSAKCYIGDLVIPPATVENHCECTEADFEWYVSYICLVVILCIALPVNSTMFVTALVNAS